MLRTGRGLCFSSGQTVNAFAPRRRAKRHCAGESDEWHAGGIPTCHQLTNQLTTECLGTSRAHAYLPPITTSALASHIVRAAIKHILGREWQPLHPWTWKRRQKPSTTQLLTEERKKVGRVAVMQLGSEKAQSSDFAYLMFLDPVLNCPSVFSLQLVTASYALFQPLFALQSMSALRPV